MPIVKRPRSSIFELNPTLEDLANQLQTVSEALANSESLTQEEKNLLSLITATKEVDLDKVLKGTDIGDNVSDTAQDAKVATVSAVRDYVIGAMQIGGPSCIIEDLPVVSGGVTLNHTPHPGLDGILNYSTAQYDDANENRYHYPLVETADVRRFTIDSGGVDLSGKTVRVQYLYHHDPQDINDMIGELILNGLTLNEPA